MELLEITIHKVVIFLRKPWSIGMDGRENDLTNSISDAVGAMERLIENYASWWRFSIRREYLIGQAKEKEKDFQTAAFHYENALSNSSWHDNANDARMMFG